MILTDDPTTRVSARRRLVARLGLLALVVATASACIFEKSDYKGGGRLGRAATATQDEEPPPDPTTTSTSTGTPDAGLPGLPGG